MARRPIGVGKMATTVTNSSRGLVRAALAFALAGLLAVLSGGLLIISGGPASSVPTADDTCVPSEAWTETTGWVLESPGDGWYVQDQQTVVDQEATHEETLAIVPLGVLKDYAVEA